MKKIVALILAAVMCIGMFSTLAYAGEEGQQEFKVGVILYDINCQWAKDIMGSLRSVGEPLGEEEIDHLLDLLQVNGLVLQSRQPHQPETELPDILTEISHVKPSQRF